MVNIRNRWRVISTNVEAIQTVADIVFEAHSCSGRREYFEVSQLYISENVIDVFINQFKNKKEYFYKNERYVAVPISATDPVFNGFKTELVYSAECYGSFDYDDNAKLTFVIKKSIRCIKYKNEYYTPYGSKRPYSIYPVVVSSLRHEYLNKINLDDIEKPNRVGTMTAKKMKEWAEYHNAINQKCEQKKQEIEGKKSSFKERLMRIAPDNDDSYGSIVKNGIMYKWNLDNMGNANEEIKIDHGVFLKSDNKIELFLMLSDNKYKPTK